MDADPQPGAAFLVAQWPHLLRTNPFAFNGDALPERLEHRRGRMAIEERLVLLLDSESRMGHPESNVAVVRQEQ